MEKRALLLTPWYFPLRIIKWQDAVKMMYEGNVDVIVSYDETISSPSVTWNVPAVIRLHKLPYRHKRGMKFSRLNVYTRDRFTCQYCDKRFGWKELSYDHVVPRSSGGRTEWTNIVTACKKCNCKKSNRTCDESGMWPKNHPVMPRTLPLNTQIDCETHLVPQEWEPFLNDHNN